VVPQAQPGGPGTGEGGASPLEALFADWGKQDSPWDLNGDGTVNIQDMLELLGRMDGPPNDDPPPAGKPDPTVEAVPESQTDDAPDNRSPLEKLLADWGKADSPWDLNGDGTVNIKDLLQLLAGMNGPPSPDDRSFLEKLYADWGKQDSPWDLNGDGTVNIKDLLELLARMGTPPNDDPPAADKPDPTVEAIPENRTDDAPDTRSPLEKLFADWGKEGSPWDLNGDGTVNIKDMLKLLAGMAAGTEPQELQAGPAGRGVGYAMGRLQEAYGRAIAENLARSLTPLMGSTEPGELRERVLSANLPEHHKRLVLERVAAWNPRGHSLSVVG
jgi:Ca2+-binding EF-hand superfamily protein